MKKIAIPLMLMVLFSACGHQKINYPKTKKGTTEDTYFGVKVKDPYRWLEDDNADDTKAWVKEQNKVTDAYLAEIPFRNKLKERLTQLWNYQKVGVPFKKGDYYFQYKNDGLQDQSVLFVTKSLDKEPRVLLDPNKLSKDGTVALAGIAISKDSKYLAYRIARSGSDWNELYVKDIATGKDLKDHLMWLKFAEVAWYKNGFFYSRYDAPKKGDALKASNTFHKVYYHKLGDSQDKDKLVYENKKYPNRIYNVSVTDNQKYMILYDAGAGNGNGLYVKNLTKRRAKFVEVSSNLAYAHHIVDELNGKLLMYTNEDAPRYKLMLVDVNRPQKKYWKTLIPEKENVLKNVNLAGGKIVVNYIKDAYSTAEIYKPNGVLDTAVKLPGIGTATGFSGEKKSDIAFYGFASFTSPRAVYKYNLKTNKTELFYQPKVNYNSADFVTEQRFFTSKDGTKVPMFIIHKKGLKLDGNNPCLLYGYGGFNISLTPYFSPRRIVWLENGGIYVVANLRGGGEYGEKWHKAGTKMQKQNVFDDCIAAAEYLIENKYTNSSLLALKGGSNGGLLTAAVVNQRPDLFSVAIPEVGVMDMLRYHKFTIGWSWASDYGTSADSKEMFQYLLKYSPIHNISSEADYPAILVTTADHDDRVVPAHSFKYIAALQEKYKGNHPVLIRIESKAGHGGGMPVSKQIEEYTDIWSFIFYNMGLTPGK